MVSQYIGFAQKTHTDVTPYKNAPDVKVAYCPMVDEYWLQHGKTIQNRFYGRSMSDCGSIVAKIPPLA